MHINITFDDDIMYSFMDTSERQVKEKMWNMEDVDAQLGDRVEDAREREVESVDKENVETKENRRRKWSLTKWRLNR